MDLLSEKIKFVITVDENTNFAQRLIDATRQVNIRVINKIVK